MEELKEKIIALCNETNLPLEAVVFVLKDAYRDAYESLERIKKQQVQEENKNDNTIIS